MLYAFIGVSRPLAAMTQAMRRLADGDAQAEIPYAARRDEIGAMSATVAGVQGRTCCMPAPWRPRPRRPAPAPRRSAGRRRASWPTGSRRAVGGIVGSVTVGGDRSCRPPPRA